MNMDKFEDYIRRNRVAFDDKEPSDGHDERFEALLDKQLHVEQRKKTMPIKKTLLITVLSVAASIALLITVGLKFNRPSEAELDQNIENGYMQTDEFMATSDYYKQQMDAQIADIMCKLSKTDADNQAQLTSDLKQLLDDNRLFMNDVEKIEDKEMATFYLIKHYKTNIEVLENINEKLGKYTNC